MGKFHSYAQRLDEAFKNAREQYTKSFSALQAAQKKFDDAQMWHSGESQSERELNAAKAKIGLVEAQKDFETKGNAAWSEFNEKRAELRRGLEKEVRAASLVDPDAIDNGALELLKSGIMTASDFSGMVEHFNGNATMTRLISKYARDAALVTDDVREKAALNSIAVTCADGLSSTMRAWDGLSAIADRCSGQNRKGVADRPEHILAMGAHWEELVSEALESL